MYRPGYLVAQVAGLVEQASRVGLGRKLVQVPPVVAGETAAQHIEPGQPYRPE